MIFLPQATSYQDNTGIIKIPVSDTERISATYLPNAGSRYTLLYIHGNAEDLGDIRPLLERLHNWGFSVFAYDYRGYGTSDGKPTEGNAYQDADDAYRYLTQQLKIPSEQIILYGRSVGGGSATELATRHSVAGLILESRHVIRIRVKQCHETLKHLLRLLLNDLNWQANCQIQRFGNSRQIDNIVAITL